MRTADILDMLSKPKVRDIASRLGFVVPRGTATADIVTFVARSLGARCGWSGAIDELLAALRREELIEVIEGEWEGIDGRQFVSTSGLSRLRLDDLRDLARDLVLAEDEDATTLVSDVLESPRWAGAFRESDAGKDSQDDDDCVDSLYSTESAVPSSLAPAWHYETILEVAPGRSMPDGLEDGPPRKPLDHQTQAHHRLREWHERGEPAGILCMPTGAGKTQTATRFIVEHAVAPGQTVLWLTHRDELVDQAIRTLLRTANAAGRPLRVGRYQGGNRKARESVDVLVASIPTLAREGALARMQADQLAIQLAIVDECHHAAAPSWKRLLQKLSKGGRVRLLGLSATPTRSAERERETLWRLFAGTVVYEAHAAELMARGVLAKPDLQFVATEREYDATEAERTDWHRFHRGDLPPSLVRRIANDPERNRLLAYHAVELSKSGPTLVFASEKQSAETVVAMIKRGGGSAALITYEDPPSERKAVLKAFTNGSLAVLVNLTIFSEGTDLPSVRNVLIGRPTTSPILFAQMVGRGLRGPEIGGTERCRVVVFHETVLNLASEALTTSFADPRSALTALGCEELVPPEADAEEVPVRSLREVEQVARIATRDPEGLRAKMHAFLAVLAGKAPPPSAWNAVPVPLCGWWFVEGDERRWYLPVFGPDQNAVQHFMNRFAFHLAGYAERPDAHPLLCLPDGMLDRFVERAAAEKTTPTFVALDGADGPAKASFAHAILGGDEGEPLRSAVASESPVLSAALPIEAEAPPVVPSHTVPPDTEKVEGSFMLGSNAKLTAPMPAVDQVAVIPPAPPRTATLPVGPPEPDTAGSETHGAARVGQNVVRNTVASAVRASDEDLRGVLRATLNVPREHRREWLVQVHERRFRERYPDVLDFVLEVMAQRPE